MVKTRPAQCNSNWTPPGDGPADEGKTKRLFRRLPLRGIRRRNSLGGLDRGLARLLFDCRVFLKDDIERVSVADGQRRRGPRLRNAEIEAVLGEGIKGAAPAAVLAAQD